MKAIALLFSLCLTLLLSGCGNDEFQGRFIAADGITSYEFQPDGTVFIVSQDQVITAHYTYSAKQNTLTLEAEEALPTNLLTVTENHTLTSADTTLTRGVDYTMLNDSTWIGHQGDYTFALTFSQTDKGMETYSELVSYYNDDMTYVYQTDDSITVLSGDKLLLDATQYMVSDVTADSLTLSIGAKHMTINKHPKGTAIEFREGYSNIDDEPQE
jgi:hypothetical protein